MAAQVVLITGGASGIGAALAQAYLARGAAVAIADLAFGDPLPEQLAGASAHVADVADPDAVAELVAKVERELGQLTTVVANAGVPGGGGLEAPDAVWERSWQVNVMAHVHLARAVVPGMVARGRGRFVSVASAAGLLTNLGNAPYSTTKHAAVAFAEWLAITYGDQGIDVRLIAPMGIETPMLRSGQGTLAGESVRALGVIGVQEAAERIMAGLDGDGFLVLTHPEAATYEQARAAGRDAWLAGMQRARAQLEARLPPSQ